MTAQVGVSVAVLGEGAVTQAVVQGGLEAVVVGAGNVQALVDDDACEYWRPVAHDASFAVVGSKAFLVENGGDRGRAQGGAVRIW